MTKKPAKLAAKPYVATARENTAISAWHRRYHGLSPAPVLKVEQKSGVSVVKPDHPDVAVGSILLMEAVGATSVNFLTPFLSQLANAGSKGSTIDEAGLNFMLSVVRGIEPKDQIEAMIAAQMAAVHMATMTFARRLAHVDNTTQQDSAERAFNKLARTFAAQMEALKRYRSGGEQKMTVEHVHVHAGGQAVVGNVNHQGGGSEEKTGGQPHAKHLAHAPGIEMPREIETERATVPGAGRQRG